MNVEELQIGDYVRIPRRNKIGKVYRIDKANGNGNGHAAVIDGDYHEKDLEPIPLTKEILEKNGFRYDGGIFYCDNEDDNYRMDIHPKETNYTGKYTFIGIEKGCITLTELPITYVHQLQHALRLCGIDKQIEL